MSMLHSGTLVAARYRDGRVLKGRTADFLPTRDHFHVAVDRVQDPVLVKVADLKALFFIKTEEGDPDHQERKAFEHLSSSWFKVWMAAMILSTSELAIRTPPVFLSDQRQ